MQKYIVKMTAVSFLEFQKICPYLRNSSSKHKALCIWFHAKLFSFQYQPNLIHMAYE
jgi:hypothetical protein